MVGWGGGSMSKLMEGRGDTLCRDCLVCPKTREESSRSLSQTLRERACRCALDLCTPAQCQAQGTRTHTWPPARASDSPILQLPRLRLSRLKPCFLNHQSKELHPAPPLQSAADGGRDAYTWGWGSPARGRHGGATPPPQPAKVRAWQ